MQFKFILICFSLVHWIIFRKLGEIFGQLLFENSRKIKENRIENRNRQMLGKKIS